MFILFSQVLINRCILIVSLQGHDTTAMALSWTLHCLGLHEDFQREVHQELDFIFENDLGREITRDDLTQMKYLECVIKV